MELFDKYDNRSCSTFNIQMKKDSTIVITFGDVDHPVSMKQFSAKYGRMEFTDEGIEISAQSNSTAEGMGFVSSWGSLYLSKSKNGSLIVRMDKEEFGMLICLPLYGTYTSWYKFQRIGEK